MSPPDALVSGRSPVSNQPSEGGKKKTGMPTRPVPKQQMTHLLFRTLCVLREAHAFRPIRFHSVAQLEAREHVQESIKDVLMKLFRISVRGCRCRELAHCVYESQQNCMHYLLSILLRHVPSWCPPRLFFAQDCPSLLRIRWTVQLHVW